MSTNVPPNPSAPVDIRKVYLRSSLSFLFVILGYYSSSIFPNIYVDAVQAIAALGILLSILWGFKSAGLLQARYFWLFIAALIVAFVLGYFVKNPL